MTPTKDESTGTEERKLFNSTKLIEINLGNTGLLKRTVSEPDIINLTRGNSIFWKKRYGTSNTVDPASEIGCGNTHAITRSRSVSLSKWIGKDTISRWRSNSAFGSGSHTSSSIGVEKNEGEKKLKMKRMLKWKMIQKRIY